MAARTAAQKHRRRLQHERADLESTLRVLQGQRRSLVDEGREAAESDFSEEGGDPDGGGCRASGEQRRRQAGQAGGAQHVLGQERTDGDAGGQPRAGEDLGGEQDAQGPLLQVLDGVRCGRQRFVEDRVLGSAHGVARRAVRSPADRPPAVRRA